MKFRGMTLSGKLPDTLCWYCKNACGGCPWSRGFTPVAGWKAIPTLISSPMEGEDDMESYLVLSCPLFYKDAEEPPENRRRRQKLLDRNRSAAESSADASAGTPESCLSCARYEHDGGLCTLRGRSRTMNADGWCGRWKESSSCAKRP